MNLFFRNLALIATGFSDVGLLKDIGYKNTCLEVFFQQAVSGD